MKTLHSVILALLLAAAFAAAQSSEEKKLTSPKSAHPVVGAVFAKAAVKALLTIEGTRDKQLVDAAMIEVSAAYLTHAELTVVWHIQLFQQIYDVNELAGSHNEDQGCIVAWLPNLRALSAEIPKQCPHLSAEEMKEMTRP